MDAVLPPSQMVFFVWGDGNWGEWKWFCTLSGSDQRLESQIQVKSQWLDLSSGQFWNIFGNFCLICFKSGVMQSKIQKWHCMVLTHFLISTYDFFSSSLGILNRENKFGASPLLPFGSLAFPGFGLGLICINVVLKPCGVTLSCHALIILSCGDFWVGYIARRKTIFF